MGTCAPYFAVCRLSDNEILYSGYSMRGAASAWVPGSVWARGTTVGGAEKNAIRFARDLVSHQMKLAARWN